MISSSINSLALVNADYSTSSFFSAILEVLAVTLLRVNLDTLHYKQASHIAALAVD
jgi:hypothetical protein